MTTVAVALATYEGAAHLPSLLESIAAQRRPVDVVVLGDDGSSDGTVDLAVSVAGQLGLPLLVLPPVGRRLGPAANFGRVLAEVTADVVLLADQDDLWHPDKVAASLAALAGGAAAVFHDAALIDGDGAPLPGSLWESARFSAAQQQQAASGELLAVLLRHPVATGATMAVRTADLAPWLPLPPGQHDAWLALGLAASGRVAALPRLLLSYRLHAGNDTGLAAAGLRARWRGLGRSRRRLRDEALQLEELARRLELLGHHGNAALARDKLGFVLRRTTPAGPGRRIAVVTRDLRLGHYGRWCEAGHRGAVLDLLPQRR